MNWIELIWHLMAGACMALSGVHLMAWLRRRSDLAHLSLAIAAAGVAAMALMEPMGLQAGTVDEFASLVRWFHVPAAVFVIAMVPFVRLRYGVGSLWLGGTVIVLRLATLVVNFTTGVNANFLEISSMTPQSWLGVEVFAPQGVANPWMSLASLSLLFLVLFLLHSVWQLWRRKSSEERWLASATLLSAVAFFGVVGVWALLVATGAVEMPFLVVPPFAGVVLALGYDLGNQLTRIPELSRSLAQSEADRSIGETQLQLAGRASGLGTWTWSCRDGAVHCSDRAAALLDLPASQPVDRARLAQVIPAGHRASLLQGYEAALQGSGEFQNEFSLSLAGGGVRWLCAVGHLERDVDGESLAVQGVLIDITQRRRAEQEAAERRNELAHLSRVALLAELSGSLAHELNQPLTAILSNAQAGARFLARDPPDLEEVRESLRDIVESDKRAGEIIRRMRAMLRKDPPDFQRLDLNEVVADVLHILHSDLITRSIGVRLELQPALPATIGDRIQLQQVLLNLVLNGCDAMASCEAPCVLTIRTRQPGPGRIILDVIDGGRGIPEEDLERIFEPFVSSKSAGLGLGLAVCRTIVQTHEGRLWAQNNDGQGATLHLELRTAAQPGDD